MTLLFRTLVKEMGGREVDSSGGVEKELGPFLVPKAFRTSLPTRHDN
jgi:hypothetical protein